MGTPQHCTGKVVVIGMVVSAGLFRHLRSFVAGEGPFFTLSSEMK